MNYCPTCGQQIDDTNAFCPSCGTAIAPQDPMSAVQGKGRGTKRLHCPSCKSTAIVPFIENVGSIGSAQRLTKNIAVGNSKSINKSYWMCQHCGHKFRNVEDLQNEVKDLSWRLKGSTILLLVLCAFELIICLLAGFDLSGLFIISVLLLAGMLLFLKKRKDKLQSELNMLKRKCFD